MEAGTAIVPFLELGNQEIERQLQRHPSKQLWCVVSSLPHPTVLFEGGQGPGGALGQT